MDQQEVNEYLNKLISGKVQITGELESVALEQLRNATAEMAQAQNRLSNLQTEIEQTKNVLSQSSGSRVAYANLLVAAERKRRESIVSIAPKENDNNGNSQGEQGQRSSEASE